MPSFFDIQLERKLTPQEYARSIQNPIKRLMIEDLFVCAEKIIDISRSDTFPRHEKPIIRINNITSIVAEGMDGLIEISSGFIDYCLASQCAPLHELVEKSPKDHAIPTTVPNALFSWTIAHEYAHGVRRHNTVLDLATITSRSHRTTEIDADLCAAADLYRWAQAEMHQNYTDLTIRKIVFSSLFWAIRGMPEKSESSTHPSNMERIYHICAKMMHLRANKNDAADPSLSTAESRSNIEPLIQQMLKCEQVYKSINPECLGNLLEFIQSFLKQKGWTAFTESWEDLRTLVSVTSGTKT